MDVIWNYILVY